MYLADYHIHSTGSPDGKCTIREMAEEAIRKGLQEICITDHLDTIYWDGRPRTDYDWESALEVEVDRLLARGMSEVHTLLTQTFERILIERALAHTGGRRIEAAHALGIGRNTITRKIQELGLDAPDEA